MVPQHRPKLDNLSIETHCFESPMRSHRFHWSWQTAMICDESAPRAEDGKITAAEIDEWNTQCPSFQNLLL